MIPLTTKRNKSTPPTIVKQIERRSKKPLVTEEFKVGELVSSGSTLFNLACSDTTRGAFKMGSVVNLIGNSFSGKTVVSLTTLAEAASLVRFNNYELIHDTIEPCNINIAKLFGLRLQKRLKPPPFTKEPSEFLRDVLYNISELLDKNKKFIYVIDSLDALMSLNEDSKIKETKEAIRKGNKAPKQTLSMDKAKSIKQLLRHLTRRIEKTQSLLIIISQIISTTDIFKSVDRAGGNALKHHSAHEIWLMGTKEIQKNKRPIGHSVFVKITKNNLTGKVRSIKFPIFYDYGIDDTRSMIDFLCIEKYWSKSGDSKNPNPKITGTLKLGSKIHYEANGTLEKVIRDIETKNLGRHLKKYVGGVWNEIEENLKLKRRPKYK